MNAILDLEWVKWAGNKTDLVDYYRTLCIIEKKKKCQSESRLISNMVAFRPVVPSMVMVFDQNNIYSQ